MEVSFNSYYLYKKYEKRANQPWLPVYPETLSIDGDGSMPKVLKTSGDPACYVEPQERWVDSGGYACEEISAQYRWVQTENTICIEYFDGKYKLVLNDSSVVSAACNSSSSITSSQIDNYKNSLVSVVVGNCVKTIGSWAFAECFKLTSVTLSDSVTTISDSAFGECSGLTSIHIPSGVSNIGDFAFIQCSGLTSVTVSPSNTTYDSRNNCNAIIKTSTNKLIQGCRNTVIPNNVTSIGEYALGWSYGLTNITIPASVTSIDDGAFSYCVSLTSITIPNTVTTIGAGLFSYCSNLTGATIGTGLTRIGQYFFNGCTSLTRLTLMSITPPTLEYAYEFDDNNALIYVPSESVNAYKTAANWNRYSSRIRAIS